MEVVSRSPLPVGSLRWQVRPGAWVLTFVCKATFLLQVGKSQLSPTQEPIHEEDSHWDDDPTRSLYAASDLYPLKVRSDVVLVGSAFAPGGAPVRSLIARLVIGEVDKSIEAVTERSYSPDGMLIGGPPFARMPLVYERAGGGPETSNPIGVRADVRDLRGRFKLPNLMPPGAAVPAPGEVVAPIGFGPIPPTWPTRRNKLGRHGLSFSPRALLEAPLPEDIDRSFFNAAPLDQQIPELSEDARIILENLHPQMSRLATSLPGLRPRATLEGRGGTTALSMRCDGLWIDSDRSICTLTWSGQLMLDRRDEPGRVVITLEDMTASAIEADGPATARVPDDPPVRPPAHTILPDDFELPQGTLAPRPAPAALPFVQTVPTPPREEARHAQPSSGLPFVQPKGFRSVPPAPPSTPPPASRVPPPPVPPASPSTPPPPRAPLAPPPVPPASASKPSAPPPAPSARPPAPAPSSAPAWPTVKLAPPPIPPPVPPVPTPAKPAPAKPADDNVWSAGLSRDPAPARSIGETVVAVAAATQTPQDGSSGVLAASNAAAGGAGSPAAAKRDGERTATPLFSGVRASPRLDARDILHLIWYEPDSVARICRVPAWRTILDEMEQRKADDGLDDPAPTRNPIEIEDKRDIFEILARGTAGDTDGLGDELGAAVRPGGKFVPPLLLLAGELSFPFDERETLKAMVAVATPIASADEALKNALREAREFLAMPDVVTPAPIVEGYTARIRDAISRGRRTAATDLLEGQVERALLEGRHYQRRQVLGMNAVRALLSSGGGSGSRPAPLYLPDETARKLPLFQRFRARLLVELYLQEDQYESHPAALKALALGRVAMSPR
ncbi:DUF2169 family type VI secretion system accessory protein [Polyangium aurulentum]|uniref:DUF2169 family type VI secretion system accessory protein n=1 Tax=Polyangium aurulentum TaxID=2567896 RepID=UPI00146E4F8E|nr:DUF2169 domain-containing protein [Polyangium aurulentum]UQA56822.1 DUF2169 domain-containing protein [Polyangium aurulentum]